jgi:uncharacterized protein (TIGR03083 family)
MAAVTRTAVQDVPPIGRPEAARLARAEYQRFLEMLRGLAPDGWERPTDCTRWTVKDVAAHIVGETEAFASLRKFVHQWRLAPRVRREIGANELIDGVTEVQVREHRTRSPAQLIERMADRTEAAVRVRERLPYPVRAVPVTFPVIGRRSVGYLVDLVITRDVWMHRVDISRATGADLVLTAEHDGTAGGRHGVRLGIDARRPVRPAPHGAGARAMASWRTRSRCERRPSRRGDSGARPRRGHDLGGGGVRAPARTGRRVVPTGLATTDRLHRMGRVGRRRSPARHGRAAELRRQIGIATERPRVSGGLRLTELTALQVREHAHLTTVDLRAALHEGCRAGSQRAGH